MNVLFWKEWRQNRLLLVGAAGIALVCLVGDATFQVSSNAAQFSVGDLKQTVAIAWAALALLCGSSMISPEVGSGSLRFLDILPVSRSRVWWVKFGFGLGLPAGCLVVALVTNLLVCRILLAMRLVLPEQGPAPADLLAFAAAAAPLYAVGLVASALFDRTISAFMASIGIAVALSSLIAETAAYAAAVLAQGILAWGYGHPTIDLMPLRPLMPSPNSVAVQQLTMVMLIVGAVPAALVVSFTVFTHGETLQTRKRFRVLAAFVVPLAVLAVGAAVAWAILWL